MEQLLINLLTPILGDKGVSAADVELYVGNCIGYVYVILIALVIAAVVIIAASLKASKGVKAPINVSVCVAWLLVVLIVANMICFGPLRNTVSMFMQEPVALADDTIANSKNVVEQIGEEGMVMVKNNGLLPLSADVTTLNVFGWDSISPIYGGTGSGSSDSSSAVDILQSLANAGYTTNENLTRMYTDYQPGRAATAGIGVFATDWTLPEPTAEYYTDTLMDEAVRFSDVAVITIGRSGGEGQDLPVDMYTLASNPDAYNIAAQVSVNPGAYAYFAGSYTNNTKDGCDFDPGDHYLNLSNPEEDMIDIVCSKFDKVIVIINANNAMELGWVNDYPQIGAVILAPGTGATGFNALGKILNGSVNPSGRTVDTYVTDLTATPYFNNIGSHTYTNVDDLKNEIAAADAAYEGSMAFVNYVEGIYVGYKFYETADKEGIINYDDTVVYPFGYGLSYTTFTQEIQNFDASGDTVKFDVVITNTGDVAGKDVVEVYFTPPYTNGGIEKAHVNLVDFSKTAILDPGKSETVSFSIPKDDFAAYDSEGIKVNGGGYILEAGTYEVSIRANSHEIIDSETFTVNSDVAGRSSDLTPATNTFAYAKGNVTYLSRTDHFANYEEVTAAPPTDAYVMDDVTRAAVRANTPAGWDSTLYDNAGDQMPTTGADNGLTLYQLRGVAYDDPKWDRLLDQMSVEDMITLVNVGGFGTAEISSIGKVSTSDYDGPAGINLFFIGLTGTAYPSEVLMAQTWNKGLATKLGDAMAHEYTDVNTYGWYGPALNTHRSAFCGRNFEYYSEDSVLAGKFASAQINAVTELGVYPYMKHFALNDQETNRCTILLTYSNEQAMREIYMRPFEIVVKNFDFAAFKPLAVMSSLNWLGTQPACASSELLTTALRSEWGFKGMVITDFDGSYGYMITENCTRTGNDLKLGFGANPTCSVNNTSATQVLALRQSSKNILYTVANSGNYAGGDPYGGMDNMTKTFIKIDIAVVAVLLVIEVAVIVLCIKKRKAAK